MELSKKVGYIKGLMAGLKIDGSTPEGQVLCAMSDLLEEMADEIEVNSQVLDDISDYLDEVYDEDFSDDDERAAITLDDPAAVAADNFDAEYSGAGADDLGAENVGDIGSEEYDEDPFDEDTDDDSENDTADEDISDLEELEKLGEEIEEQEAREQETEAEDDQPTEPQNQQNFSQPVYDCRCPICGVSFRVTQKELDYGKVYCPNCGNLLEFGR